MVLLAFGSCKSVRKVTGTDKSGSASSTKKYGKEKREFINGIEVFDVPFFGNLSRNQNDKITLPYPYK